MLASNFIISVSEKLSYAYNLISEFLLHLLSAVTLLRSDWSVNKKDGVGECVEHNDCHNKPTFIAQVWLLLLI